MKLAILALVTLGITSSAHALTVGDSATYNVFTSGQNHTLVETVSQINSDTYTVTTIVDGTAGDDQTGSVSQIDQMDAAYPNCAEYGGEIVPVAVGIKSFDTCHINQNGEDLYFSPDVTFGIVELITTQDGDETATLTAFVKH